MFTIGLCTTTTVKQVGNLGGILFGFFKAGFNRSRHLLRGYPVLGNVIAGCFCLAHISLLRALVE
jgi:hypothetical protein